uniref:Ribosome-binding factor A, mitochondrial n=1 Tax=Cacopsylla melanoneura TaxID=428564 RepID=A0A8D8UGS2_9HEMI
MVEKMCSTILKQKLCFIQRNLFHTNAIHWQTSRQLINTFIKMSATFEKNKANDDKYSAVNGPQPKVAVKFIVLETRFVRRENVVNKLFMSHITDILSSGNLSENLGIVGKGVEISKVQVSPDFNILYIFWTANEREPDNEIQEFLDSCVPPIRKGLSDLRIVRNVPKICFLKHTVRSKLADINKLFSKADYGEDFMPMYPSLLNADHMKLSNPIVLEKLTLEDLNEMPVMRNDTLRIDHTNIMKSIEKIIQKSKAPHTKTEAGTPLILGYSKVPPLKELQSNRTPPVSYAEYVKSQKILSLKLRKEKLSKLIKQETELSEKLSRFRRGKDFWQ